MEDLKRLMLPAIAAIILHGLLVSFQLPKQQALQPAIKGMPITITMNSFSPKTIVPEKRVESKKEKKIPGVISPKKVVQKKLIKPPITIPQQQKKVIITPELTKKEVVIEDKDKNSDHEKQQLENQPKKNNETPSQEIVEKSSVEQVMAGLHTQNIENEPEVILPGKASFTVQKKAMPMYRQNKQPPYPVLAIRRGYEGEVLLHVLVDNKGFVPELKIKHSSGHISLDRAALKTVKNWLFTPAIEGGRSTAMWVDVPIVFELK